MVAKLDANLLEMPCGRRFINWTKFRLCIYLTAYFVFSISCKKAEDVIMTDSTFAHLLVWLQPQTCWLVNFKGPSLKGFSMGNVWEMYGKFSNLSISYIRSWSNQSTFCFIFSGIWLAQWWHKNFYCAAFILKVIEEKWTARWTWMHYNSLEKEFMLFVLVQMEQNNYCVPVSLPVIFPKPDLALHYCVCWCILTIHHLLSLWWLVISNYNGFSLPTAHTN